MNLRLVEPDITYKEQAIAYIEEHYEYNSPINGSGGLHRYLDNYEGWLDKLASDRVMIPNNDRVPALTYYLVNEENRIIGMCNLRLALNEKLENCGGHIGYGIRPTERRRGYNKINLYLALEIYESLGIDIVYLDCDTDNIGSRRTMEQLGGILLEERYDPEEGPYYRYQINVKESLRSHRYLIDNSYEINNNESNHQNMI